MVVKKEMFMWFIETMGIVIIGSYIADLFGIALFRWGDYVYLPVRNYIDKNWNSFS